MTDNEREGVMFFVEEMEFILRKSTEGTSSKADMLATSHALLSNICSIKGILTK